MMKMLQALTPRHFGVAGNSWRYALANPYGHSSQHLAGVEFENDWITVQTCNIVIREGYAWDGCSPCISICGLFYVGPPDGAEHLGVPATYHASLVHDALCQWRKETRISKSAAVAVFHELLVQVRFPLANLYTAAVDHFGPQDFHRDSPHSPPNTTR